MTNQTGLLLANCLPAAVQSRGDRQAIPSLEIHQRLVFPRSAYIHVPFCAHRCGYCDFTLIAGRDDLIGDYLKSLDRELATGLQGRRNVELDTLFFGGGTPTHPSCDQLRDLFQIVFRRFRLAPDAEVSVEANPLDLTDEKIDLLAEAGVTRISLGVQSFSPQALTLLERDHSQQDIGDVCHRLHRRFQNLSLDLIFGVPDQSREDWVNTLNHAIQLNPEHISTYGLTWEAGTAFGTRRDRGELTPIDEETERDQYALAMSVLSQAGYEQYEISNFARPGFACRHNEVYWAGKEYWAFGPGAARYLKGRRETNIRSVLGWLARIERGESPVADAEELEPSHRARELLFLGLRRIRGISRAEYLQASGFDLDVIAGEAIRSNVGRGWLEETDSGIRLTREGRFVADRVVADFL
jgi:oxygen-independent coproporphyrinogen-3 oxidase